MGGNNGDRVIDLWPALCLPTNYCKLYFLCASSTLVTFHATSDIKWFSPLHLQDRNIGLYSLPRLYKLIYSSVICAAQKRREKTSCSTTYVRPIIYCAHNYIIPRGTYARLICSKQHRSYLLVPRVLEVPGDPLFHLYRPYLKKNKNILELLYFEAKEKLARKTRNLFFNISANRVAKLCCAITTHRSNLSRNKSAWFVGGNLLSHCSLSDYNLYSFFNFGH